MNRKGSFNIQYNDNTRSLIIYNMVSVYPLYQYAFANITKHGRLAIDHRSHACRHSDNTYSCQFAQIIIKLF